MKPAFTSWHRRDLADMNTIHSASYCAMNTIYKYSVSKLFLAQSTDNHCVQLFKKRDCCGGVFTHPHLSSSEEILASLVAEEDTAVRRRNAETRIGKVAGASWSLTTHCHMCCGTRGEMGHLVGNASTQYIQELLQQTRRQKSHFEPVLERYVCCLVVLGRASTRRDFSHHNTCLTSARQVIDDQRQHSRYVDQGSGIDGGV